MITTCSWPGWSSSAVKLRPSSGCTPSIGSTLAEMRAPFSCSGWPAPVRLKSRASMMPISENDLPSSRHSFEWRAKGKSFSEMGSIDARDFTLTGAGQPEQLKGARISASVLPMLGVQPELGRNFTAEDDQPGHEHVVIISDALWSRRFHRDPGILGRTLTLDETPHTVIGVLPASFELPKGQADPLTRLPERSEIFRPTGFRRDAIDWFGQFNYSVIARLRPGVPPQKALAEVNVIQAAIVKHATA